MAEKFRKASLTTNLFGGAMHHTEDSSWATWCCGFLFFDHDIGLELILGLAEERLLKMPRFRSRYDPKTQGFYELEKTDLSYHVRIVEEELPIEEIRQEYVGDIYKHMGFDKSQPLWQLTYFPNVKDGRSLLLTNIAHVIGDGISQIEILYRLLDKQTEDDGYSAERPKNAKKKKNRFGPLNRFRIRAAAPGGVVANILGPPDTFNPFSRADTTKAGKMKIAFAENCPLEKVKDIKKKLPGTTINDIMFGAMNLTINACLKDYQEQTGDDFRKKGNKIRFGVAINTRGAGEDVFRDGDPHNSVAQGLFRVEFDYKSRADSIWIMKRKLDIMKKSPLVIFQQAIGNAVMSNLPKKAAIKKFLNFYATSTAVVSNVPGPKDTVFLGGKEVKDFEFLLSSPKGCYIGLLSYNGTISVCISLEETTLLEPEVFCKCWQQEFDALYDEVMSHEGELSDTRGAMTDCL